LNKRVYTALEIRRGDEEITNFIQPNDYLLLQHESTPVAFTEVTIEAVTPRSPKIQDKAKPMAGGAKHAGSKQDANNRSKKAQGDGDNQHGSGAPGKQNQKRNATSGQKTTKVNQTLKPVDVNCELPSGSPGC
jgi:hypothetical protein